MHDPRNYENYDVHTNRLVPSQPEFGPRGFYENDPLNERPQQRTSIIDSTINTISKSNITKSMTKKLTNFGSSFKSFWSKMPTSIRGENPGGEEFISKFYGNIAEDQRTGVKFEPGLFMENFTR